MAKIYSPCLQQTLQNISLICSYSPNNTNHYNGYKYSAYVKLIKKDHTFDEAKNSLWIWINKGEGSWVVIMPFLFQAKDGVNVTLFIHPYHGPSKVSPTQQWFLTQGGRLSMDN